MASSSYKARWQNKWRVGKGKETARMTNRPIWTLIPQSSIWTILLISIFSYFVCIFQQLISFNFLAPLFHTKKKIPLYLSLVFLCSFLHLREYLFICKKIEISSHLFTIRRLALRWLIKKKELLTKRPCGQSRYIPSFLDPESGMSCTLPCASQLRP
jgi:hypothetical protein